MISADGKRIFQRREKAATCQLTMLHRGISTTTKNDDKESQVIPNLVVSALIFRDHQN